MANLDPGAVTPQQNVDPQDAQLMANLLGSLLPLLQRVQLTGWTPEQAPPMADSRQLDQRAAVALAEDITADALCRLAAYCERYAGGRQFPGLDACLGLVTQAARCFAAADYNGAMALVWQAYRLIAAARAATPELPPLREIPAGAPATSH